MAKAAVQEPEAEVLETTEIEEAEDQVQPETEERPEVVEPEEEETVIGFADDEPEEDDSPPIKTLRERNREQTRLLREKDKRIAELEQARAPAKVELGPKPTLESCGWDEAEFETKLDQWKADEAKAKEQEAKVQEDARKANESWQRDFDAYTARKSTIGIPDYQDAEDTVVAALNKMQQAVIVKAANDPNALVVALSRSPDKLAEIAKYDDPVKLAAAIARMEGSVKVTTRKKSFTPDRPQRGSAPMENVGGLKEQLAKAEAAFDKAGGNGDRTEIQRLQRLLKAQEGK